MTLVEPTEDGTRRVRGRHGELALRSRDGHHEIISNGVMLMDTRNGESERLLVRRTLQAASSRDTLLIGGLGVGFSLAEAIANTVPAVTVVECERAIIEWNRTTTGPVTGGSVDHPAVTCIHADLVSWIREGDVRFDAICLDIDNGPGWTVGASNAWLYSFPGLRVLRDRLVPGGALGVWSADRSPAFEERLRRIFDEVEEVSVPVRRGAPDVVYVARAPHPGPQKSGPQKAGP